jgi:hypothetical protein
MKLYISGPISNYPEGNKPCFDAIAKGVRQLGHAAVNPWDLDLVEPCGNDWIGNMKRDIRYLVDCDGVVLLPNWEESQGARLEVIIAAKLEMPFYYLTGYWKNRRLVPVPVSVENTEITAMIDSSFYDPAGGII